MQQSPFEYQSLQFLHTICDTKRFPSQPDDNKMQLFMFLPKAVIIQRSSRQHKNQRIRSSTKLWTSS